MGVVMSFAVDGHARNSRATAYYKILSRPPSGVSSNGRLGSQAVEDLIRTGISQGRSGAGSNEKRRPSALSSIIDRYCARHNGCRQQHNAGEEQRVGDIVDALQQRRLGRGEEDGQIK